MSMDKRYEMQFKLIKELKEDFQSFKQNEPSIIQPINYPISLSDQGEDRCEDRGVPFA